MYTGGYTSVAVCTRCIGIYNSNYIIYICIYLYHVACPQHSVINCFSCICIYICGRVLPIALLPNVLLQCITSSQRQRRQPRHSYIHDAKSTICNACTCERTHNSDVMAYGFVVRSQYTLGCVVCVCVCVCRIVSCQFPYQLNIDAVVMQN